VADACDDLSQPITILVAHWGRTGAGPSISHSLATALAAEPGVRVIVSYNSESEIVERWSVFEDRYPIKTYGSILGAILLLPKAAWHAVRLREIVQRESVDVVYSPMMQLWFSLFGRFIAGRAVLAESVHDAQQHLGDESRIQAFLWTRARDGADAIVTYSTSVADSVRDVVPHGVSVIESRLGADDLGREVRHLRTASEENPHELLLFGRIREYKGLPLFVDAVKSLRRAGYAVHGRIVGDGRVPDGFIESSDFITWEIGWVPENAVATVVDEADLVVLPYTEASQSAVLTAAAGLGVPAVVTPVGGLMEQAEELGMACVASAVNADAVAEAIAVLLTDARLYETCSARGLQSSATSMSWAGVARRLLPNFRQEARRKGTQS